MIYLVTTLHVLICFFLIIVVLLQSGKAADLAGAFGGMGSQTVFGPRGTGTVLSRATTIAASLFMLTALGLAILENRSSAGGASVIRTRSAVVQKNTTPSASKSGSSATSTSTTGTGQPANPSGTAPKK